MELSKEFLLEMISDWFEEYHKNLRETELQSLIDKYYDCFTKFQQQVISTIYYGSGFSSNAIDHMFQHIYEEGGGEGGGEDVEWVFRYKHHFIKVNFDYMSYEGHSFDYMTAELCEPREVVVTQYFPI